jgi:hypothetical protein
MDTWILRMCRRSCVRQLAVWVAAAVFGILLVAANTRYFTNFWQGPFPMGASELSQVTDATRSPKYFVQVAGSRAIPTGIEQVTVTRRGGAEVSRRVSAEFYALDLGDKFLIVKSSQGRLLVTEGELAPMPLELEGRLFVSSAGIALSRGRVYPFYLDAGSFKTGGYVAIVAWLIFLGLAFWKARPAWRFLRDPSTHPVVKRASTWGDPVTVSAEVEREFGGTDVLTRGSWHLTPRYLVMTTFFGFQVLRWWDLIWAYKQVTRHSVNFIPTGKTYAANFHCYGGSAAVRGPEAETNELLKVAMSRAPWAIFGHSAELANAFSKKTAEFLAAVEDRRKRLLAAARPTRG